MRRALIPILVLFAAPPALATDGARARIFDVVRDFEAGDDRALLAPDATLELVDLRRSDRDRKRLWRDVPGSGVTFERRVVRMAIRQMSADRAIVDARATATIVDNAGETAANQRTPITISDRIELRRSGESWRIHSVTRRVRD